MQLLYIHITGGTTKNCWLLVLFEIAVLGTFDAANLVREITNETIGGDAIKLVRKLQRCSVMLSFNDNCVPSHAVQPSSVSGH